MPLVDERGRLFGKINLIDAGVGVLVFLLIPLGYAAYRLFRTPVPTITTITPIGLVSGENVRLRVQGENLRPYLRVTLGARAATFLVESPTAGEVQVNNLLPGTYDLVFYDVSQEVTRARDALTIPALMGSVRALGWFTGLDKKAAQALFLRSRGDEREPSWGRILGVQPPEPDVVPIRGLQNEVASSVDGSFRVIALLMLRCMLVNDECRAGDTAVKPGAVVTIPQTGGTLRFRVEEVHSAATESIDVRVRFVISPDVFAEFRREAGRARSSTTIWGLTPSIVSFEETQTISVPTTVGFSQASEQFSVVRAVLRVPAQKTTAGWEYRARLIKVGEFFTFESLLGVMRGVIVEMRVPEQDASGRIGEADLNKKP